MVPVKSSMISAIGWEGQESADGCPTAKGILVVKMKAGPTYRYAGVSKQIHEDMLAADSVGAFFGSHIRGRYAHTQAHGTEETQ